MTDKHTIPTDPQALAEAVATAMWARDRAGQALGMRIEAVGPGTATLAMPVRGDMVNGHHICHGGMIFSLADTAFAYACNSYNKNTVASACHIDFLAPAKGPHYRLKSVILHINACHQYRPTQGHSEAAVRLGTHGQGMLVGFAYGFFPEFTQGFIHKAFQRAGFAGL